MMNDADLTVFGSTAYTSKNMHLVKIDDTITVEETFNAIAEDPVENGMLLTEFNYEMINPVLRYPIFYMPGRRRRQPSKYYYYLAAKSRKCLCAKYSYKIVKDDLFKSIDRWFERMLGEFQFRMYKAYVCRLDVGQLQEMIAQDSQTKSLFDTHSIRYTAGKRIYDTINDFWLQKIKRQYLTIANAQDELGKCVAVLNTKDYNFGKVAAAMRQLNESYEACISCLRMRACGGQFYYKIDQDLKSLTDYLHSVSEAAVKCGKVLQGRFQQHRTVLNDIVVAQSTTVSRLQSFTAAPGP